ncbi:MAG: adenylate/guanylate cyclase domain-containing protein [Chloroflexota bacterium]
MPTTCPNCGADNPEGAKFCLNCATPLHHEEVLHEERKLATVLFADLVGSTAMAGEQDDPERTRMLLNRFYDAMTDEVQRYGGTVEKFAGDAVMAAFGAPAALEDHAERALHAGLAMHERLTELFGGRLALRIGINTGEVIVGRPREGSSFVTGDAVNVAARLEQAAGPGETIAGERTVTAALGAFEFADQTVIEAKGKPGGVPARRVLRAVSLMRPRGVRGMPSVFVGREADIAVLQDRYRSVVSAGEPHLVSIFGEAGVGKTRLMRELSDWLAGQSPVPIHRTGRVLSYGKGITYWPMADVLKQHFGISEGDSAETISDRLVDHAYLGLTLGIASGDDLHPLVARERLHDAWVDFLADLTRERPMVLLIEDAHWAEDQLCDLIDTLVAQVSGPLLVLVTARPELLDRRPAWGGAWDRTSAMRLDALPPADTGRLLSELLGADVPEAIRGLVVERAEGNPFFVEELIATLVDRGVLQRANGSWRFGQLPAGFTVPDSVQAVLAARIDLLPDPEKEALQAAAVIGRTFWTGPIYELAGGGRPDIGLLEDREFVRRRPTSTLPGEREYVIKHALTREVAYESLPRARRAKLHADFAAWLDRRMDGRDELAPFLAHHYASAVRPEDLDLAWAGKDDEVEELRAKAVSWLRKAADLSIGRYEIDDGIALLRRAVELEPDQARQADLWQTIGHASALKYDGEGLVAAMQRALELGARPGEVYPELAFQFALRSGMWLRRLDDSLTKNWVQRALADSADGTPARVHALVAKSLSDDDLDTARAALTLAEQLDDPLLRSDGLGALENVLADRGELSEACEVAATRTELLPHVADPDRVADTYLVNAQLYMTAGRLVDAREMTTLMQETVAGLTPHHRVHGLAMRLVLESAVGDWQAVRELTQQTEAAVEANLATPCPFNVGLLILAATGWTYAGNAGECERLLARSEKIGMTTYVRFHRSRWLNLAIARHDGGEIRRLIDSIDPGWLTPSSSELWAALFDGLVELEDWARIEAEAPRWLRQDNYVTPFAVRALAFARSDEALLTDAAARFETMGLDRHAQRTRALGSQMREDRAQPGANSSSH